MTKAPHSSEGQSMDPDFEDEEDIFSGPPLAENASAAPAQPAGEGEANRTSGHELLVPSQTKASTAVPGRNATNAGDGAGPFGSMFTKHRIALWIVIALASVSLFGNACFAAGLCLSSAIWRRSKVGAMRRYVERIPVCQAREIDVRLPVAGGYDCIFSKPLSSRMLIRLEAYVERPLSGSQLTAPLTKKTCVLYSSAVSRHLHDGVHPVPVAFSFASVNFSVLLADAPDVRVEIKGSDVSLFDMYEGRHVERRNFERVPDDWQDFISSHRTSPHLSATLRSDGAVLEFQECTLCVGALVTLVGELVRDANGTLSMRPWLGGGDKKGAKQPRERWRTSWEDWSCVDASAAVVEAASGASSAAPEDDPGSPGGEPAMRIEKVLISDSPELRGSASTCCWRAAPSLLRGGPCPWAGSLFKRRSGHREP